MNIKKNKKFIIVIAILVAMIFGTFLISLNMGSLSISPGDVIKTLIGQGSKAHEIAIFKLDQNNNQTFLEKTDISTEYLTEKDLENIKRGIIIYSKKELNKTIEDFE